MLGRLINLHRRQPTDIVLDGKESSYPYALLGDLFLPDCALLSISIVGGLAGDIWSYWKELASSYVVESLVGASGCWWQNLASSSLLERLVAGNGGLVTAAGFNSSVSVEHHGVQPLDGWTTDWSLLVASLEDRPYPELCTWKPV